MSIPPSTSVAGGAQPPASEALVYITLLLAKAYRGEKKTHSVEEAQRGVTAKYPKYFHHPDMPLRCSQPITGNPYYTQPSSYPYHIQAYNQHNFIPESPY